MYKRQEPGLALIPGASLQFRLHEGCFTGRVAGHCLCCLVAKIGRHGIAASGITHSMPDPLDLPHMGQKGKGETGVALPAMGDGDRFQLRKYFTHKAAQDRCRAGLGHNGQGGTAADDKSFLVG